MTGMIRSTWARAAISGTTPRYRSCNVSCEATTDESTSSWSVTTAAAVSSHVVSRARTSIIGAAGKVGQGVPSAGAGVATGSASGFFSSVTGANFARTASRAFSNCRSTNDESCSPRGNPLAADSTGSAVGFSVAVPAVRRLGILVRHRFLDGRHVRFRFHQLVASSVQHPQILHIPVAQAHGKPLIRMHAPLVTLRRADLAMNVLCHWADDNPPSSVSVRSCPAPAR